MIHDFYSSWSIKVAFLASTLTENHKFESMMVPPTLELLWRELLNLIDWLCTRQDFSQFVGYKGTTNGEDGSNYSN